ncbi:PTS sugar transporter subunit IIC [Culicoidibacter larvae]|uniref:Permease IIC component n=1 Tax=Culicoidibacter larvae TaxID=2579976 RepID=A0A5R8QDP8_9FIRM|nr:PTS transporter subunit EIIC [Culicoidibacter larvae]TLG75395.1 PTS sugar transporter subunit IIC [Culicoidibacter larvae]
MKTMHFMDKLTMWSGKVASNRYISAIRDGMSLTIPLVIIGSFFVLFMNLPIDGWKDLIAPYSEALSLVPKFTSDFMALFVVVGVASSLAQYYDLDRVTAISLSIVGFLISAVQVTSISADQAATIGITLSGGMMSLGNFGATGLFTAMITTIFSVEIIRLFAGSKLTVKMPHGVPASVANSFAVLVPAIVVILVLWVIRAVFNIDLNEIIRTIFSPLSVFAGNSLLAVIVPILVISFFWLLGIHGMVIVTPILTPLWYEQLQGNMNALAAGATSMNVPNIVPEQFFQWFVWIGGAGATLGLVLCMVLFAKSKFLKQFWKFTLIPSIFNINEPIMFGLPIIMNPLFAIPFIASPVVMGTVTYLAMSFGLVGRPVAVVPWTLPGPLGAFMSTNFNIGALILCVVNILISMAIYYPFFKVMDNKLLKEEQATDEETVVAEVEGVEVKA